MKEMEMRQVYAQTILELSRKDQRVVALEADLSSSMSTNQLKAEMKDRYINVGIMEAEQVGAAAGLAVTGFIPFIHTFAPFASRRVFDQVFISLGYAQKHAIIVGSDAGVTAEMNGGTHMPFEDMALMRAIPKNHVYDVSDPYEFKAVLEHCYQAPGLHYIRTIRKQAISLYNAQTSFAEGVVTVREGTDATIFATGIMVAQALAAAEDLANQGISVKVIDAFRVKPLNAEAVIQAAKMGPIVTAENHNVIGGLGSAVAEITAEQCPTKLARIGVKEQFGQVGKADYLMEVYQLTRKDIAEAVKRVLN